VPAFTAQRTARGQAGEGAQHHHDNDVLRPQLALKEEGAECVGRGCVGCFEHDQMVFFLSPKGVVK